MHSSIDHEPSGGGSLSEVLERAMAGVEEEPIDPEIEYIPPADVKVTPHEIVIFLDLPGMDEDEISIDFHSGVLMIHGTREFDHDQEDAEEFVRIERRYGRFAFATPLEPDADFEHARAKYRRGVLKVRVPRDSEGSKQTLTLHSK